MTDGPPPAPAPRQGLARFLELQNLGLNLPFALSFLLLAAGGVPGPWTLLWVVVAFVAARNAGHSFNRWADREYDAANPRTRMRALVTGERSPSFALGFAAANGVVLVVAAYLLNPLAFLLSPVALLLLFGYSYSKRYLALTTVFLGVVEAIAPPAVFIAVRGSLPPVVLLLWAGMLVWGTAFETIHSLGDIEADRAAGLHSIPLSLGATTASRLVPVLHVGALALWSVFALLFPVAPVFRAFLGVIAGLLVWVDYRVLTKPSETIVPFRAHFVLSGLFLVGVVLSYFGPWAS